MKIKTLFKQFCKLELKPRKGSKFTITQSENELYCFTVGKSMYEEHKDYSNLDFVQHLSENNSKRLITTNINDLDMIYYGSDGETDEDLRKRWNLYLVNNC